MSSPANHVSFAHHVHSSLYVYIHKIYSQVVSLHLIASRKANIPVHGWLNSLVLSHDQGLFCNSHIKSFQEQDIYFISLTQGRTRWLVGHQIMKSISYPFLSYMIRESCLLLKSRQTYWNLMQKQEDLLIRCNFFNGILEKPLVWAFDT